MCLELGDPLDFDTMAGTDRTSWRRAKPEKALIEPSGHYVYLVTLPDGEDAHRVAVAREDGEYFGTCDCKGFEHHPAPCAHLCTVRKAAFIGETDVHGDPVRVRQVDIDAGHESGQDEDHAGQVDRAIRSDRSEGRP